MKASFQQGRCPGGHRAAGGRGGAGFALVFVLTTMSLIFLLVLGLLAVTAGATRAATSARQLAVARSNAAMALALALGDLQRTAGPDRAATARADIINDKATQRYLTGVWRSWKIEPSRPPNANDYEKSAKAGRFLGWLVSYPGRVATRDQDFAASGAMPGDRRVTLVGSGTLGPQAGPDGQVEAARMDVPAGPTGGAPGSVAWAVLDEGVKARIDNGYEDKDDSPGMRTASLGSGRQAGLWHLAGLDKVDPAAFDLTTAGGGAGVRKWANLATAGLGLRDLGGEPARAMINHDLTVDSVGLMVDVVDGELRKDLSLLSQLATLPARYAGAGVYATTLGFSGVPSDPKWDQIHGYERLYRDVTRAGDVPLLASRWPTGWQAATTASGLRTPLREPPRGVVVLPVVAKVQMLFSLIARDLYDYPAFGANGTPGIIPETAPAIHEPQADHFRNTPYDWDLHLLYTPIVTLYNPYNVAIEFHSMRVEFSHVPFSMQIFRNGIPQSTGLVPLESMYGDNRDAKLDKVFGLNIKSKSGGRPGSATVRLLPGEVKLFSPYIDPNRTYRQDLSNRTFWDIYVGTGITNAIDAIPGWRGDGIGYDLDNVAGALAVDGDKANGHWTACMGLARYDQLHVLFAPLGASTSKNQFTIQVFAAPKPAAAPVSVGILQVDYESPTGLQDVLLGKGTTIRYPETGTVSALQLLDHASTPIKNITRARPFALFSAYAKTTHGGLDTSVDDGRWATQPWSFTDAVAPVCVQKAVTEHPSHHSHDLDLTYVNGSSSNFINIDDNDRGLFIRGHTSLYGLKLGTHSEIPLAPVQTLPGLNGANLAGSGYLPRFDYPVGNSFAHPLLGTGEVRRTGLAGYPLADHSFLLNLALFDHYYHSGLADQSGAFLRNKTTSNIAEGFFTRGERLPDQRLAPLLPGAVAPAQAAALVGQADGYLRAAALQGARGAFNVNSTSVAAWKAVLASIQSNRALCNFVGESSQQENLADLPPAGKNDSRFSRFRLPNGANSGDLSSDPNYAYWQAPRDLTPAQLDELAAAIVRQVKLRGPFLSMGEFVNRQLGKAADPKTLRGALQAAIDEAGLNHNPETAAAGFQITEAMVAGYKYATPEAGTGPSAQGAPGFLTQADLLAALGNGVASRSDTFRVRAYGDVRDGGGRVVSRATCEAVVQRMPDYLDPADEAHVPSGALQVPANRTFGRRFLVKSFRWLDPSEV